MRALLLLALGGLLACGSKITVVDGDGDGVGAKGPGSYDDDDDGKGDPSSGAGAGKGVGGGKGDPSSGAGAGQGSSGSSGSGGSVKDYPPPSEACFECTEIVGDTQCELELDKCFDDLACATLLGCYEECDFEGDCMAKCNEIVAFGHENAAILINCAACGTCADVCAGSTLGFYCL